MSSLGRFGQKEKQAIAKKVARKIEKRDAGSKKISNVDIIMKMINEVQFKLANYQSFSVDDMIKYIRDDIKYFGNKTDLNTLKRQDNYTGEREKYNLLNRLYKDYKNFNIFLQLQKKVKIDV